VCFYFGGRAKLPVGEGCVFILVVGQISQREKGVFLVTDQSFVISTSDSEEKSTLCWEDFHPDGYVSLALEMTCQNRCDKQLLLNLAVGQISQREKGVFLFWWSGKAPNGRKVCFYFGGRAKLPAGEGCVF